MITMVNQIELTGDEAEFRAALDAVNARMRRRPGFLGYQLLRSQRREGRYVMVARWESAQAHLASARDDPQIRELIDRLARVATSAPDVYEVVDEC